MANKTYKASKTRSQDRPGWSVIFSHPLRTDTRGKSGLKVRRGLGTKDDAEADRLVDQLNILLGAPSWWSLDRRAEAEQQFDSAVVKAFFDKIEVGKIKSKDRRETIIPLPKPEGGYARVMLVGSTGAGKTTLLRQLIGSDQFPSTSTARTTTADIEIVNADTPFQAVITFTTEHEVRCAVDECLEEACASVIHGRDDKGIATALLGHREQRFRLSYILGSWQQRQPGNETDEYEMDYSYDDETTETETLPADETISGDEITANNERLREYVSRIKKISTAVREQLASEGGDFQDMDNANKRYKWLEKFIDALYDNRYFVDLSLDIMDAVAERFSLIAAPGEFEPGVGWPDLWRYEETDRSAFLKQVRWFSGNHHWQFGRLLTPLVDGIRVRGPFQPAETELQDDERRLVLIDGEGLGHSAKEASSVSTKVTEKFSEMDMILLVDNAQSPMQAAPLELLRSVGSSGHGDKIAIAFTHFDQVKGENLSTYNEKRNHVRDSIANACTSLRESLGAPVTEILERRLESRDFYLGGLDRATNKLPLKVFNREIKERGNLLEQMKQSAQPSEQIAIAPFYNLALLELPLRDATDGFKHPWMGRLGLTYYEGIRKEHWGRVKALCRRLANRWDIEYNGLRPVADLIRQLQIGISLWLDNPNGWTRQPESEDERHAAIDAIRQRVFKDIHDLAEQRIIVSHQAGWRRAFAFSGIGSSNDRAKEMAQIYDAAAPSITSVRDMPTQEFLDRVIQIVQDAVEEAGGSVEGISARE